MAKTFTFQSIARPTWRYRLFSTDSDNPAYDWRRANYALCSHLSQFDTMNDGEVQHSPDCLVKTEDCYDVVMSLAMSLSDIQFDIHDRENCTTEVMNWFWRSSPSADDDDLAELGFDLLADEDATITGTLISAE